MIQVKICGITRLEDAQRAVREGASALGFIFYPFSPRYVTPDQVKALIQSLSSDVKKVGVFVNTTPREVNAIVKRSGLDMAQLSGHEPAEICDEISVPVIKTFQVGADFNPVITRFYDVHAFLLDTLQPDSYGGTGKTFEWSRVSGQIFTKPFILSGGLNPENIQAGIRTLNPHAVDINSGIEARPGVKDPVKLKRLFKILRKTKARDEQVF
ncbi:MAG: phosphoribosylanthranilate isomerase [Fidelibacterota bacterium]|nr:MAG: phosphoribosylanthranilate isomerase [Candidatus Neomarinimicrobiota bacterium]